MEDDMTCPNLDCENHVQGISEGPKWYIRYGSTILSPSLEVLYGNRTNAERFVIDYFKNQYAKDTDKNLYIKRYFLSFEWVEGTARMIWLQKYKMDGTFIPRFIAG